MKIEQLKAKAEAAKAKWISTADKLIQLKEMRKKLLQDKEANAGRR